MEENYSFGNEGNSINNVEGFFPQENEPTAEPTTSHHSAKHADPPDYPPIPTTVFSTTSSTSKIVQNISTTSQNLPINDQNNNSPLFNTEQHGYFFLVLQEFFILFIALVLLNRYGNIKKLCKTRGGSIICCSVWFSWFFALNVILLLPLDISVSLFKQCQVELENGVVDNCGRPWNYVSPPGIKQLWRIVYWGSFLMSWVILPFLQSYKKVG